MNLILLWLFAAFAMACTPAPQGIRVNHRSDKALQDLQDRAEIAELTARFADAVNRHDWQAMADLYVEGAIWQASAGPLSFRHEGRARIHAWLVGNVDTVEVVFYQASPPSIELLSAERARTRLAITELLRIKASGELKQLFGTYDDELVKLGGRWRFALRSFALRSQADSGGAAQH